MFKVYYYHQSQSLQMSFQNITSTFLDDVKPDSVQSIPEKSAIYKFYRANTNNLGYILNVGCTTNLKRSATDILSFFQSLEIQDDRLILEYYLSDDMVLLRELNRNLSLKYEKLVPSLSL